MKEKVTYKNIVYNLIYMYIYGFVSDRTDTYFEIENLQLENIEQKFISFDATVKINYCSIVNCKIYDIKGIMDEVGKCAFSTIYDKNNNKHYYPQKFTDKKDRIIEDMKF